MDFFQNELFVTLHDFDSEQDAKNSSLLERLPNPKGTAVLIPALYSEFERPAMEQIIEQLSQCLYIEYVIVAFYAETKEQYAEAKTQYIKAYRRFCNLPQTLDWFFGFKLHLVVNELGEIVNMSLTPGNIDDRKPVVELLTELWGKVFADRGYVSQKLATKLLKDFGIEFFAKPKRNMKNKLMKLHDKLLSRKRSIIETINDQLKNVSQIEHSRHRSPINFCVNILCGLIAYCHQPKKPSLCLEWLLPQSA